MAPTPPVSLIVSISKLHSNYITPSKRTLQCLENMKISISDWTTLWDCDVIWRHIQISNSHILCRWIAHRFAIVTTAVIYFSSVKPRGLALLTQLRLCWLEPHHLWYYSNEHIVFLHADMYGGQRQHNKIRSFRHNQMPCASSTLSETHKLWRLINECVHSWCTVYYVHSSWLNCLTGQQKTSSVII